MKGDRLEGLLVDLDGLKEQVKHKKYKPYEGANFLNRVFQSDQLQINAFMLQSEDFKESFYNIIRAIETNPDAMVNPNYLKAYNQHLQIISQLASALKGGSVAKPTKTSQNTFSLNYLTDSASLEQMRCRPRQNISDGDDDQQFGSFEGDEQPGEPGDLLNQSEPAHHPHTHRSQNGVQGKSHSSEINFAEIVIPMADTNQVMEKLLHQDEAAKKDSSIGIPGFSPFPKPQLKQIKQAPPPPPPEPQPLKLPFLVHDNKMHQPEDIWGIKFDEGGQISQEAPKQTSTILDLPTLPILLPYIPGTISLQPVNLHQQKPVNMNDLIGIDKEEFTHRTGQDETNKKRKESRQQKEEDDEFEFVQAEVQGEEGKKEPEPSQTPRLALENKISSITPPPPPPIIPKLSIFDLELDPDPILEPIKQEEPPKKQEPKQKTEQDLFDFSQPSKIQTLQQIQKSHPPDEEEFTEAQEVLIVQKQVQVQPYQLKAPQPQPQPIQTPKKIATVFDMDEQQWGISTNQAPQMDLKITIPMIGNKETAQHQKIPPPPPVTNITFDSLPIYVGPNFTPAIQPDRPIHSIEAEKVQTPLKATPKKSDSGDEFGDFADESAQDVADICIPSPPKPDKSSEFIPQSPQPVLPLTSIKAIEPQILNELPTSATKKTDEDEDDQFQFAEPAEEEIPQTIPASIPAPSTIPSYIPPQTTPNLNGQPRGRLAPPSKHLPQVQLNVSVETSIHEEYLPRPSIGQHWNPPITQSQFLHNPHEQPLFPQPVPAPAANPMMFHSQIRLPKKVKVLEGLEVALRDDWRKIYAINKWECNVKFYRELKEELQDLELWAEANEISQELKKVEEITQLSENYSKVVEEDEEQEVTSMVKLMQNKIMELKRERTKAIAEECIARSGLSISGELSNKVIDQLPEYEEMFKRIIKSIKNPQKRQQSFLQLCLISVIYRNTFTQKCKAFKAAIERVIKQSDGIKAKLNQMQMLDSQQITQISSSEQFKSHMAAIQKMYSTSNRLYEIVKIYEGQSNLKFRLGKVKTDLNNLYTSINCSGGVEIALIADPPASVLLEDYFKPYIQALQTGQPFPRQYIRACEICLTGDHTHQECKAMLGL